MLARYTHLKAEAIALEIDRLEKERDKNAVKNQTEKLNKIRPNHDGQQTNA